MTIIAVSGMRREARVAGGPGVSTLVGGGNAVSLRGKLEHALAHAHGIISIGIAGGLAPSLRPGDCVVASEVVLEDGARRDPDAAWTARIIAALPDAIPAPLTGVNAVMTATAAKAALFRKTGAYAVDMESHIVARFAEAYRLPFAVLRTISDPANSALPPLASVAMTERGRINLGGVLKSLLDEPGQISLLIGTARDSKTALDALLGCRRALGFGLLGPDGSELALDMR